VPGARVSTSWSLAADNGHMSSPMSLRISGQGLAELFVGGPASLPGVELDRVGAFASNLTESELAELRTRVESADIEGLESPPGPLPSGDYATLVLDQGGERLSRAVWQQPTAELDRLLSHLLVVAAGLLEHPVSAVRASIDNGAEAEGPAEWRLVLQHLGSEDLPLQLFDPAMAGYYLRVRLSFSHPSAVVPGELMISRDAIVALVHAGQVPEGVSALGVGQQWVVPLAEVEVPAGTEIRGTVDFWIAGPGPARRSVRLRIGPTALGQ